MRFGVDTIVRLDVMRVLYDHQAFVWSKYAGIPRYFSQLIQSYDNDDDIEVIVPDFYTISEDYRCLGYRKKHIMDNVWDFGIRDGVIQTSLNLFNKNPTKLLCTPSAERASIKKILNEDFDLFHPTHFNSYFQKYIGEKPYVLTIHDLSVEIYPEYVPLSIDLRKNTEIVAKSASGFIADSENTKRCFGEYYDVDPELITTIHLAPTFDKKWVDEILKSAQPIINKKPYFLFVNMRHGRKNCYTLVNAIRKILVERDMELICVGGGPFTRDEKIFLRDSGVFDRVIQCTVSNEELYKLYKSAVAFLYPSVDEGFGLPILEAFSCGCPVVLSNASCFPEIAGDAGLYFNPKSIGSIREAVYRILDDEKLRESMRERGYKQLERFSWKKCAEETKKVYEKVME